MADLEELQKELKEILNKEKSYDNINGREFSNKAAVIVNQNRKCDFLALGTPSDSKTDKLSASIVFKESDFFDYNDNEKGCRNYINVFFPVGKELFEQALEEVVGREVQQKIPSKKAPLLYQLIIDYFKGNCSFVNITRALKGKGNIDEIVEALEELKKEKPLKYYEKKISFLGFLIDSVKNCDYKNEEEIKKLEETIKRAGKLGIETEGFETQIEINEVAGYIELFEEQDQKLPAEIRKLKEKDPKKALAVSKALEQKAETLIKEIEANEENIDMIKENLRYFEKCEIDLEEVKRTAKEKFNWVKNKIKKKFKEKLKKVSSLEEELGF